MSAEETVQEAIDVVDQTLDILENTEPIQVVKNNPAVIAAVAVVSLAAGAGLGYILAKKHLDTEYNKIMEEELERTRNYYAVMHKREEYATPESTVVERLGEDAVEALRSYSGQAVEPEVVIEEQNIFVNNQPVDTSEWDYELEQANRDKTRPYVISQEEYLEAEPEYEQVSYTYYEGDDALCDAADRTIDDIDNVIGEDNLTRFGHGSGQHNIVYIRNDRLEMDFEVAKSTGKYAEEVLGFIEHSDKPRSRRARWGDDE